MSLEAGEKLSHYSLIEKIGEGGMGVVWRAHDTTLDRNVAIKVLPEELAADAGRLARFEREAKAVAALNHPNIITVHSVEKDDGGLHFFTMEPVAISYRITPSENRSERWSTDLPSTCSGDM